ncbi:hypothetical protein ACP275_11G018200 [Erythranthe tilingii]
MGSKREDDRNEKIIRGLMKLPPNRRCINCNSLGPQYVCTNFWTFVCTTCSGIHREFTHRVKSVSMAKFTSQEVDALQKGGNQRARELFFKAWDPQRQRLPDNSNAEKVREFIKNVYVDKRYAVENSSDRPPRDPQSIRSHEDETRRASSYHSYSQSPPYDFQYEERRYGKHVPSLTRKPGSDRGLYEGKLSSFLSPSRLSDQANDERFANEGSNPRASDYSVSGGGDTFKSDVMSPNSQREIGSPFSETSSYFSSETHGHNANSGSNGGRTRNTSSGSFGSFDSTSFRSGNSIGFQEIISQTGQPVLEKTSSLPSLPKSSISTNFNGMDLFNEPYAPQNNTSTNTTVCNNTQWPESVLVQSVDLFQQHPISSVAAFSEPQPSQTLQPSPLVASSNGNTSDVVMPNNGGWATFDNPIPATVPSSDGNNRGNFNPFSIDHSSSASTNTPWHDGRQNVETTTNNAGFWNAFEDPPAQQPIHDILRNSDQANVLRASDANKAHGFAVYEAMNDGNVRTTDEIEPSPSNFSSNFSMVLNDFSMAPAAAGVHPLATGNKPTNPFDLPYDAELETGNVTHFWDMSSLQAALPSNHMAAPYVVNANEGWFPQNSVPFYTPGGVAFDPLTASSLGFIVGQAPNTQISNVPAQGPVAASIGGNPFA